jgi:hypothetical protein
MSDEQQDQEFFSSNMEKDRNAFESYIENIYSQQVPSPLKPEKKDLSFWKIAGLEASLLVLAAVGGAGLSSLRTGTLFYLVELALLSKFSFDPILSNTFGFASMVLSLFAFECYLLGHALKSGRDSQKMNTSKWGLFMSFATIIGAGLFASFNIIPNINQSSPITLWVYILISLISGVGSGVVAFYSASDVGHILNQVDYKKNQKLSDHQDAYARWLKGAYDAYNSSKYNFRNKRNFFGNTFENSTNNRESQEILPEKFSGLDPKVSEKFRKFRKVPSHWRRLKPLLSHEDFVMFANFTSQDISAWAVGTGKTERTIQNWRTNARVELFKENPVGTSGVNFGEWVLAFADQKKSFPTAQDLKNEFGLDTSASNAVMLDFVNQNKQYFVEHGLLDQSQLAKAEELHQELQEGNPE